MTWRWVAMILGVVIAVRTCDAHTRPNILILYADDMGYGDLGIQNSESKIATPHLDQLAREGTRFTDAHSSSGICTPSRYALLTGCYHWRKFHQIVESFGPSVFDAERLTLPEMLQSAGYRTACFGKWHLGWGWDALKQSQALSQDARQGYAASDFDWSRAIPDGPLAHGFMTYFGDDVPNFPPYTWIRDDHVLVAPTVPYVADPLPTEGVPEGRPGPMAAGWKQDAVMPTLTEKVIDWLAEQQGATDPFFLYFPWTSPHAPIVPSENFQGKSQAGSYGDFVQQSDDAAGKVLAALDRFGLRENTLVIFSADNGPEQYAYERLRRFGHRSMGPLRGLKRDLWEGGHRVPFLVRWPGVVPAGRVCDQLVSQIDVMATLAAIVDVSLPPQSAEDSFDLSQLWFGAAASPRHTLVHNTNAGHYAYRKDQWLLIDANSGTVSDVPAWFDESNGYTSNSHPAALFDLKHDLAQKNNLFAMEPDRVQQMRAELKAVRVRGYSAPRLGLTAE